MTDAVFRETTAEPRTQAVPLSHLSLELGHLYMEDFEAGPRHLRRHFAQVRPWADAARAAAAAQTGGKRPRISTCFLVDDYFTRFSSPAELVPLLLAEADRAGLAVDYLARESGCAVAGKTPVAEAVADRLVEEPPPGSYGLRPPAAQTGWLANGGRSPAARAPQAMKRAAAWQPPKETAARRHSVFLDVELWSEAPDGQRTWSCPFLAAVWQLARLGLLRTGGEAVLTPRPHTADGFPEDWDELPPLIRLNPRADPFAAYRTCSVVPNRFLPVEHAVRVVLDQTEVDPEALSQVARRSAGEKVTVPDPVADRVSYVFYAGP
ncbi:SCO2522 family protein [Streptomyces sp. NEAU-W12]|uniref:SCO2522 family protein n=1 Tax=Streptomyces sp. NEAU-W12 TaxID=2994668 RepID=UPI00224A553B|nr:SCO2522 family protein [Streptomyces sp. NEAU-W12]MCX2925511.1 SCO2522 family protein [Streptomyces sp. NEAU-W12]